MREERPPALPSVDASPIFRRPSQGSVISRFDSQKNKGLDFAGSLGDPVLAGASGRVVYAGSGLRGYGQMVIIKHNDTYLTAYAHNSSLLVAEGDVVSDGQQIARMGSTDADRIKLHFEVRRKGVAVDPSPYLLGVSSTVPEGPVSPAAAASPDKPIVRATGERAEKTTGSGFAVTSRYVVTNAHVVSGCKTI